MFKAPRYSLTTEFICIFILGPILLLVLRNALVLFGSLWVAAFITWLKTRPPKALTKPPLRPHLKSLLQRFCVLAPCILLMTWLVFPHNFLSLPRTNPKLWGLVLLLYPVLSVWPQEMLYRRFLFTRYSALFSSNHAVVLASALAFGFAHILFLNAIAIGLCTIGGLLFARDYAKHNSLLLSCIEHALYGCLLFTAGLGRFFYTGAAWHH
ncbi:CPBP family intramembrane metalloprotease [Neokomagataea tanensis]|uniref:CPBP family intramembrane metalloprotease n=1 Tax=Neokomagataea tanensis TaxID=661191 RepID=A0A4Y6V5N4_9PROT|nr:MULTISPECIES: CPBP family intramembrane glutamic endopeptidase [Neokomagataea]QDH25432.1 CPBP family intramembrane metalloprotease [Neokomagataea tanensis]